jgi:CRISPR-associated protein Cmr4
MVLIRLEKGSNKTMSQSIRANLFLYTETSLHAGTGSTVSVVDLPIQRERTTQYPMVQGSGVKGALRSQYTGSSLETVFGPETNNGDAFAGAITVGDARILLFPVQSLAGVFAYTTSTNVLARLVRDLGTTPFDMPQSPPSGKALVPSQTDLIASSKVVLEEFSFDAVKSEQVDKIASWIADNAFPAGKEYEYWRQKVRKSLIILPEDDFRDFTLNSTEIATRVKLDRAAKTVMDGALWTEESLPSDSLLFCPILANPARDKSKLNAEQIGQYLTAGIASRIQLGGDETTGSGFVAVRWL